MLSERERLRCFSEARARNLEISDGECLDRLLSQLAADLGCTVKDLQLDHDPALENRPFNKRTKKYTPDANNPDFLIYREKHAHRIKTHVRGDGAQLSDAAIARKRKRIERKKNRPKTKWASRGFSKVHRPLKSRSTFR